MLFILTGNVQTGKTRWLESLLGDLETRGVSISGVLAPGVWRELPDNAGFEKLGIDNVLLPQGERLVFARRQDLAEAEGLYDADSQSAQANLKWEMPEDSLDRVNAHLRSLVFGDASSVAAGSDDVGSANTSFADTRSDVTAFASMLVIDEVGRLELLRNGGLTAALDILDAGPSSLFDHTLVIVREALLPAALERFEPVWGSVSVVSPDETGREALFAAFGL
ncbi:MAG: hypothetical protein IKV48_04430 [Eggerthellaceae bacterium]|nr:hypothetical protein [Eggerthellaceae bacterium]